MIPTVTPDLVRVFVVFIFVYASVSDYNDRVVSDDVWVPFVGIAILAAGWDIGLMLARGGFHSPYFVSLALSFLTIPVIIYPLWEAGFFGGADAKALGLLAVLFPAPPVFELYGSQLPIVEGTMGVFALTVFFNALVFGAIVQSHVFLRNVFSRNWARQMTHSLPTPITSLDTVHGEITATNGETIPLRLVHDYAIWTGAESIDMVDQSDVSSEHVNEFYEKQVMNENGVPSEHAFEQALDQIIANDTVWVTPDMPFIVFITLGLMVALTVGSLVNIFVISASKFVFSLLI